jgi:Arc/MetJ-type ribon-helix-helix transcriptional regulator
MTKPYIDALNRLVTEGIYLSKGEIVLEALRLYLRQQGIEPFARPLEEKGEQ